MEVGLVRSIDIDQTMQQAYLDYAMSVIVARALPDARDGPELFWHSHEFCSKMWNRGR